VKQCTHCKSTIVFGGIQHKDRWYCGDKCVEVGYPLVVAETVPKELALSLASKTHSGSCPICGRTVPIDVHKYHRLWSVLVYSQFRSLEQISCRRCGIKTQVRAILFSMMCGWWSPRGFFLTPICVFCNLYSIAKAPKPGRPSDRLLDLTKLDVAKKFVAREQGVNKCPKCGAAYKLTDYRPDVEHIYCTLCKTELSREVQGA